MVEHRPVKDLRRFLFAPSASAPGNLESRGSVVCNCLNISSVQIDAVLKEGADLKELQTRLGCGTSCGSCLPELRLRIARARTATARLAA
jgi:assimilatory nitrate reductase catalytic subunit